MQIKDHTLIEVEKGDIIDGICTIPEEVTSIGSSVFWGATDLKHIIFHENITCIGSCAFYGCINLKELTLPNGITTINDMTFQRCYNLESVHLPNGITHIGDFAFKRCRNLKNISLPETIRDIGDSAFYGCYKLESINIPEEAHIKAKAFANCPSLNHIQWGSTPYRIKCLERRCMHILKEKQIGTYTVYRCKPFPELNRTLWGIEKDGQTAIGVSIRYVASKIQFHFQKRQDISEHITRIKGQGYVIPTDYMLLTGACENGVAEFLERKGLNWTDRRTIEEVIQLTKGEYGHEAFAKALGYYESE